MTCKICHQDSLSDICSHCRWGSIRIITPTSIRKTYKLSKDEISDIKFLGKDGLDVYYDIRDVWNFCERKYENVSDDNEKKILYQENKRKIQNIIEQEERHNEVMKIINGRLGPSFNYNKWKFYNDYMNGYMSKEYMINNIENEINMQIRQQNVVAYIKTLSGNYRKRLLKSFGKNPRIQKDYIEDDNISFETVKEILCELEKTIM